MMMRGGLQQTPINETVSCYSETMFIDHVSINPVWHLSRMSLEALEEPDTNTTRITKAPTK